MNVVAIGRLEFILTYFCMAFATMRNWLVAMFVLHIIRRLGEREWGSAMEFRGELALWHGSRYT